MFAKLTAVLALASVASFVVATPVPNGESSCSSGEVQCCNSAYDAQTFKQTGIAQLLGINVGDITGMVGASCSPIGVVAGGGNSWSVDTF